MARKGMLKKEAKSLEHKLTHRYKQPYCDSCVRVKTKHFKTQRGSYSRQLKRFGDLITFDAVDTSKVHSVLGKGSAVRQGLLHWADCCIYPSSRMTARTMWRGPCTFNPIPLTPASHMVPLKLHRQSILPNLAHGTPMSTI